MLYKPSNKCNSIFTNKDSILLEYLNICDNTITGINTATEDTRNIFIYQIVSQLSDFNNLELDDKSKYLVINQCIKSINIINDKTEEHKLREWLGKYIYNTYKNIELDGSEFKEYTMHQYRILCGTKFYRLSFKYNYLKKLDPNIDVTERVCTTNNNNN